LKSYTVRKYQSSDYPLWNEFVANAKNATFLFHRDFMEYHSDRFEDFSLLVFDEKNHLKAILPANRVGDNLYSHQGLTYGGVLLQNNIRLSDFVSIAKSIFQFLKVLEFKKIIFKLIPSIYSQIPSDELQYLSFLLN
jgi:hypothetical protein